MTPEMIAKARTNAAKLGYQNVEFRLGKTEHLPVEAGSVDAVISNCVLNLVPDKARAFAEILRVLKPGARFCVSDIVSVGELPDAVRRDAEFLVGCVAGAIDKDAYRELIRTAGFSAIRIAEARRLSLPAELIARCGDAGLESITVVAIKPENLLRPGLLRLSPARLPEQQVSSLQLMVRSRLCAPRCLGAEALLELLEAEVERLSELGVIVGDGRVQDPAQDPCSARLRRTRSARSRPGADTPACARGHPEKLAFPLETSSRDIRLMAGSPWCAQSQQNQANASAECWIRRPTWPSRCIIGSRSRNTRTRASCPDSSTRVRRSLSRNASRSSSQTRGQSRSACSANSRASLYGGLVTMH
jgi:hypothetical protein